jgi:hypothetical protein
MQSAKSRLINENNGIAFGVISVITGDISWKRQGVFIDFQIILCMLAYL